MSIKPRVPTTLDLGSETVTIEIAELGTDRGYCQPTKGRIVISSDVSGAEVRRTLWHEVLHIYDEHFLAGQLSKEPGHPLIDQLSTIIDMTISRNTELFGTLYGPMARSHSPSLDRKRARRPKKRKRLPLRRVQ